MIRPLLFKCSVAVALALISSPLMAQDFEKGLAAYQNGDFAIALSEWMPLAEQGDALAQSKLGLMYYNGDGVPQDYSEAVKWYRLAAEQGDASAQSNLGVMYDIGEGVPQDYLAAYMWLSIATANDLERAREMRDENVANKMTPDTISEAQSMARECLNSGYQDCGS